MLLLVVTPLVVRYALSSFEMKEEPRSLCAYDGKPNTQNNVVKCEITVALVISRQGKAKEYRLNSSITNSMYLLRPSKEPLKSLLILSQGRNAFMSFSLSFS